MCVNHAVAIQQSYC